MNIELKKQEIFIKLVLFILFLLLANISGIVSTFYFNHDSVYGLVPLFNFDTEKNIPTLYSSFSLITCSILLYLIAYKNRNENDPWIPWIILSFIFIFLSIDETASIHERFGAQFREIFNTSGLLYFSWVIPYGVALGLFIVGYSNFLLKLPKNIAILFITSGFIFTLGAVGFELLGGRHVELYGNNNILYSAYYTCEELLEMLGIATFIYTLLSYITEKKLYFKLTIK